MKTRQYAVMHLILTFCGINLCCNKIFKIENWNKQSVLNTRDMNGETCFFLHFWKWNDFQCSALYDDERCRGRERNTFGVYLTFYLRKLYKQTLSSFRNTFQAYRPLDRIDTCRKLYLGMIRKGLHIIERGLQKIK